MHPERPGRSGGGVDEALNVDVSSYVFTWMGGVIDTDWVASHLAVGVLWREGRMACLLVHELGAGCSSVAAVKQRRGCS